MPHRNSTPVKTSLVGRTIMRVAVVLLAVVGFGAPLALIGAVVIPVSMAHQTEDQMEASLTGEHLIIHSNQADVKVVEAPLAEIPAKEPLAGSETDTMLVEYRAVGDGTPPVIDINDNATQTLINITGVPSGGWGKTTVVTIYIPTAKAAQLKVESNGIGGDTHVSGKFDSFAGENDSGNLNVAGTLRALTASTLSGDVTVDGSYEELTIQTDTGHVRGTVAVSRVLDARVGSGDFDMRLENETVQPVDGIFISATEGDVDLAVPKTNAPQSPPFLPYNLQAHSTSGHVYADIATVPAQKEHINVSIDTLSGLIYVTYS